MREASQKLAVAVYLVISEQTFVVFWSTLLARKKGRKKKDLLHCFPHEYTPELEKYPWRKLLQNEQETQVLWESLNFEMPRLN